MGFLRTGVNGSELLGDVATLGLVVLGLGFVVTEEVAILGSAFLPASDRVAGSILPDASIPARSKGMGVVGVVTGDDKAGGTEIGCLEIDTLPEVSASIGN